MLRKLAQKAWSKTRGLLPITGFLFDRPLVLIQSDDWGRVGVRDQQGWELLRSGGVELGQHPYDFYTLETAADLAALRQMLLRHRDSTGRSPVIEMNFLTSNLDFSRMAQSNFREIHLLPLSEGLPEGWQRPGLIEAYKRGIEAEVFYPALHGTTHFCRPAVKQYLDQADERGRFVQRLWKAGTPYIHWRMPWIGYEYWDPEQAPDERFLSYEAQLELIGCAVGGFAKLFGSVPWSACAPGYRANEATNRAWARLGIRVAQRGPVPSRAPHVDSEGILEIYRSVDFEPATNPDLSVDACLRIAEQCFTSKVPLVLSSHSINFHSTLKDYRTRTLEMLDTFLSALESRYPGLLYVNDRNVYDLVQSGSYESEKGRVNVGVAKKILNRNVTLRG